jgi:hypothetical protein
MDCTATFESFRSRLHRGRAGEWTSVWVPEAIHEAVRDLVRARETVAGDLRKKRQQLLSFMLHHERIYTAATIGSRARALASRPGV